MTKKILASLAFGLTLCAVAPSAHADTPKKQNDYEYKFTDDLLSAPDGGGNTPMIKVRPQRAREMLLRPRIQFVTEMLKSVENL